MSMEFTKNIWVLLYHVGVFAFVSLMLMLLFPVDVFVLRTCMPLYMHDILFYIFIQL